MVMKCVRVAHQDIVAACEGGKRKQRSRQVCSPKVSSYIRDYGPKYAPRTIAIRPKTHSVDSGIPMERVTEFNQNFTPKQVAVPESYAPKRRYSKPDQPMLLTSQYKQMYAEKPLPVVDRWPTTLISYRACRVSSSGQKTEYTSSYNLSSEQLADRVDMLAVRLAPIRQKDNLLPEEGSKMETTTTNREAYKGARQTPAHLIRPKHKPLGGVEPFQGSTENRDSFTRKPIEPVKAYKLKDNEIMSGSFEGCSGYKDDFKPRHAQKIQSFAPSYEYRRPSAKFASETTNQKDFVPYKDVKKQPYSVMKSQDHWKEMQRMGGDNNVESTYKHDFPQGLKYGDRADYQPPSSTLKLGKENVDISTNYKDDFTFKSQGKPKSYAPTTTFIRPGVKMDSSTEAKDQFKGEFQLPPPSFRPRYEIDPSRPPMDMSTNYSDSFRLFKFVNEVINDRAQSEQLPRITSRQNSQPEKRRMSSHDTAQNK